MTGRLGLSPETRVLVTGAAGFIGSHLCDRLLELGHDVVGLDCFSDFYARGTKEQNISGARRAESFRLVEADLAQDDLSGLLEGIDVVMHLAAQGGVRGCFGGGFKVYIERNVLATQRLLEEAARSSVRSFTYASSSSIYGDAAVYPTTEDMPARPVSPYGMTKLATEQLAGVYARCYGLHTVGLRYFTVYGPRQRPDMAFHRFITRCLDGQPIQLIGDGRQVRDFTFVGDAVEATIAAAAHGSADRIYNIGGGHPVELRDAISLIGELVDQPLTIERSPALVGEARQTGCDGSLALRELGFAPATSLGEGIAEQVTQLVSERELVPAAA